uniref:Uncharacterized protein n=1 Tax=Panagrolaimus sp. ES5 TaxID=591445 RepID=A0AC34GQ68_9BILA
MEEYSTGSNVVICKCTTSSCDAPHIENDFVLDIYRNTVVCNQGSAETILPSPSFYCYVRLTVESENGKNVKIFNYSFIDQNIPYEMDLYKCWSYQNLYEKMTDSEVHEAEITTCFHDIDAETFECCCLASHKPCNSREIIETYYKMVNQEAKDKESRTQIGCNFTTNVLTEETCKNDVVQNDREMKCYGVFKIPSTRKNSKALKPILVKESKFF